MRTLLILVGLMIGAGTVKAVAQPYLKSFDTLNKVLKV